MCGSLRNNEETFTHMGKKKKTEETTVNMLLFLDLRKEKYHF